MPDILTKENNGILEITLNRPEYGNAVTNEMISEITRLVNDAPESTHCILLRAVGDDFCVGREAKGRPPVPPNQNAVQLKQSFSLNFNFYAAIRDSPMPVIAVVQGRAIAFGCAIAAIADITIAGDKAQFQVPELEHSKMPTAVLSSFVDRVSRKAVAYLAYSSELISADHAFTCGLVSKVVPAAQLDDFVQKLAYTIAKVPLPAVCGIKEYVGSSFDMPIATGFAKNLHAVVNSSEKKD